MKQKITSLFTAAAMITILFGATPITSKAATSAATIQCGSYVQMGTYNGRPILWRCVAFEKIIGTDDNGNPITDSTNTTIEYRDGYLPLMLADNAIDQKPFDAIGSNTGGSHGRESTRATNGSNYWADSNIRDWLNSSAAAGNVVYTCGNEPTYADEAGFLSNFTDTEKSAMKTATQKSILTNIDKDFTDAAGSETLRYNDSVSEVAQNYHYAYSELVTDTMFLLDVQQLKTVYHNTGDYYEPLGHILYHWLRTPMSTHDYLVRIAFCSGEVVSYPAYASNIGVRPAFYLNPSSEFICGEGTFQKPYTFAHTPVYRGAQAATCTEAGNIAHWTYACCHKNFSDESATTEIADVTIPPKGHNWDAWTVTKPATTTEAGERTRSCRNNCGAVETDILPATGTEKDDYILKYENGKATITVPQDGIYTVLFTAYDGNKLTGVSAQSIPLVTGENPPISPKNFDANGTVKVMLWDSFIGMHPICVANGQ